MRIEDYAMDDMIANAFISPIMPEPSFAKWDDAQQQKKENKMCKSTTAICVQAAPEQQDMGYEHLRQRVYTAWYEKRNELEEKFFLTGGPKPKTFSQAQQWLAEGNYTFTKPDADSEEDVRYYGLSHYWRWGKDKPDRAGYEAAEKVLIEARDAAMDIITVNPDPTARLAALQTFLNT